MAEIVKTLLTQILLRNDTETNWSSVNPVLGKGEIAISIDKNQFKIGDGESNWSELSYFEGNLATKVANLEAELYGAGGNDANSRLDSLQATVDGIVSTGGQANVLEVVKVKDEDIVTFDAATKTATIDLGAYAKSAVLADYATTEYVNNELKSYATTNALTEAIKDFVTDGELATKLTEYVTLEAYNLKVAALEKADQDLDAAVKAIYKKEGEVETGVLMDKLGAAANEVDAKLTKYETAEVAQGKYETKANASATYLTKTDAQSTYETIAEANKVRDRVTAVEEAINGTGEGTEHQPGLVEKVQANANAISALQQAQAGGLVREIITKEELDVLIADPSKAADNAIYMVPNQGAGTGEANDVYDEYIKVRTSADGVTPEVYAIEFLGDTEVDLSQYYTKTEIDNKGYATTSYVDGGLADKVDKDSYDTDQNNLKGRVDKVEAKLSDIAEGETVKAVIDAAVKVEKDRAELAEKGLGDRVTAIENLKIGETYATKAELQKEAEDRANEDTSLGNRIKAIEDLELAKNYALKSEVEAVADRVEAVEGKLEGVEETVVKTAEAAAASAVAGEATLREQADQTLQNNINTEKARIDTLVGKTEESEGDAGKSVRAIAEEVHEANEYIKSVDAGLSVDSAGKLSFAEGVFVLDGGNASNRPTQTATE